MYGSAGEHDRSGVGRPAGNGPRADSVLIDLNRDRPYTIVVAGAEPAAPLAGRVVRASTRRDVERLLFVLRDAAVVLMDDRGRAARPDISAWLAGRDRDEVLEALPWPRKEAAEMLALLEGIPLPDAPARPCTDAHGDGAEGGRIDRRYVHKRQAANVIVSTPTRCGGILHFRGFLESPEIRLDHASDHLEGILIFEAIRQAAIASVHIAGVPLTAPTLMLDVHLTYAHFVRRDQPYLIRTVPVMKPRGGLGYVVYEVLQDGHACAAGYISGLATNRRAVPEHGAAARRAS